MMHRLWKESYQKLVFLRNCETDGGKLSLSLHFQANVQQRLFFSKEIQMSPQV